MWVNFNLYLFANKNKLEPDLIKFALESYLKDKKIVYKNLSIIESKEITEQEYLGKRQYS